MQEAFEKWTIRAESSLVQEVLQGTLAPTTGAAALRLLRRLLEEGASTPRELYGAIYQAIGEGATVAATLSRALKEAEEK